MSDSQSINRRRFVQTAVGALSLPWIVPSAARAKGAVGPNDKVVMGFIGTGGRGGGLVGEFQRMKDVQVVAVCDLDQGRREGAARQVDKGYAADRAAGTYKGCAAYADFRELVARDDLDAICVATPDHWHALATIAALKAGKDVYCEKPLANSIPEGRAMVEAAKASGRIVQVGSHERSTADCRKAAEYVRNGRLGQVKTVRINLPCNEGHHKAARAFKGIPAEQPVPAGFNYDLWLGHTPLVPYCAQRCHFNWRFILNYGGGEMTDRGAHVMDIAQLALGLDGTGPVSVEAKGVQTPGCLYDTWWDYDFTLTYANGVKFIGSTQGPRGMKFEGDQGSLFVNIHGGRLQATPSTLLAEKIKDDEVQLGRSPGHTRNFIDCVRSRKEPFAPVEAGHRTASLCHLTNLAMKVGRPLKWDPVKEQILDDAQANALLMPPMRAPWKL